MKINKYPGVEIRLIHAPAGLPERYTQMEVSVSANGHTYQYVDGAICGPNDQFSRKFGRQLTARRVFRKMRNDGHSEDLCKEVMFRVCPEFRN